MRGFNFDLYPNPGSGTLWTKHGTTLQDYDPTNQINKLVAELKKNEYRDEVRIMTFNFYKPHFFAFRYSQHQPCHFLLQVIVVQLQNGLDGNRLGSTEIDYLVNLFGGLLIDYKYNYHLTTDLGVAIEANQRVYLVTNEVANRSKNFFRSADVIGENHYKWKRCKKITRRKEMPLKCRDDPTPRCSGTSGTNGYNPMLLMNSFCGVPDYTNEKCRLLKNAERMSTHDTFTSSTLPIRLPNILMVDFFEKGDVFGAQQCLRDGNIGGNGCETCKKYD